jgi:hypothetical protein
MRLYYSVVASFTGWYADPRYWPSDVTLRDVCNVLRRLKLPFTRTRQGDSEYSYLAEEDTVGFPEEYRKRYRNRRPVNEEPFPSKWDFFRRLSDVDVSGILNHSQLVVLTDDLGLYATNTKTMGTLGGPLSSWGGVVPDICLESDSSVLICSVRVTPFCPEWDRFSGEKMRERFGDDARINWYNRVRSRFIRQFGVYSSGQRRPRHRKMPLTKSGLK